MYAISLGKRRILASLPTLDDEPPHPIQVDRAIFRQVNLSLVCSASTGAHVDGVRRDAAKVKGWDRAVLTRTHHVVCYGEMDHGQGH
jgi:hypothetical protein